jgi:hypothetical protein
MLILAVDRREDEQESDKESDEMVDQMVDVAEEEAGKKAEAMTKWGPVKMSMKRVTLRRKHRSQMTGVPQIP